MQAARQGHCAGCIATSLLLAGRQLCEQISYSVIFNHGRACLRVMPKFSECPSPDQYLAGALHHRAPHFSLGYRPPSPQTILRAPIITMTRHDICYQKPFTRMILCANTCVAFEAAQGRNAARPAHGPAIRDATALQRGERDELFSTARRLHEGLRTFPKELLSGSDCPGRDRRLPCVGAGSPSPCHLSASPGRPEGRQTPCATL